MLCTFRGCFRCRDHEYHLEEVSNRLAAAAPDEEPPDELRARVVAAYHRSFDGDGRVPQAAWTAPYGRLVAYTGAAVVVLLAATLLWSRRADFGPPLGRSCADLGPTCG